MKKVAVIQFPGTNSEYETRRAVCEAGMDGQFFRWNEDPTKLDTFDGFVIAGGFSYEDRGRSGVIASMDSIMKEIRVQAAKGKPVLGICNGAQILVETGLIPGGENNELLMSLAHNKRVRNGELIGVGFYNENVWLKSEAPKARCAFTIDFEAAEISVAPAAHGEGRFTTTVPGLLEKLRENNQIVFRYSDKNGVIDPNFPVNPNGAIDNAAAICNPQGNVMAIMPHPERSYKTPMPKIFSSMQKFLEGQSVTKLEALKFDAAKPASQNYTHTPNTIELLVELLITDNEAQTVENALKKNGFDIHVRKLVHYQVDHRAGIDQDALAAELIASGELLNTNKEKAFVVTDKKPFEKHGEAILVRDMEDSAGASKTAKIHYHLGKAKVAAIHRGTFWELTGNFDYDAVLATNVFANHHAQILFKV
jgi:phosphoribosylformylglycinamidine synthase